MFQKSKDSKPRVRVILRSNREALRRRSLPRPASIFRTKFTERSPTSLEADIIVVDNSKQSTSKRSVEITRDESDAFTSKPSDSKRNRLFDPLSAISSRLSRKDNVRQLRLTIPHIREEDENSSICSTQGSLSTTGNVQLERKPEERSSSIAADEISASARPVKKPITFPQHEQFATPSTSTNSFSDKDFNIEIRRDVADFRVVNSPTRKNPSSQKEEAKTPSRSLSYVHKSETLTVIMPKRWVTGVKPDVETQATVLPVKQNDNNKTSDLLKSPAGADKSSVSMRKLKKGSDKLSSGLTVHKDDLQPVSDDDSDCKPNCEIASDLSVVKSVNSGRNIIPFSSEVSLFSNHFPCRQLFIHGQRFFSAEQYYVWTKAKFCKDFRAAATVLCLKDPKAIAEVGNHLKNVDATRWMTYSWKVRMKASMAKFKQNRLMRYQLFRTIGSVLVEATSGDTYWGIGLSVDNPDIADSTKWRGYNVMGEILMQIRDVLKENPDYADEVKHAKQHLFRSS